MDALEPGPEPAPAPRWLMLLAGLAVLVRLPSLNWLHPAVWDEIEFFRATDWIRRGLVPYRDFWEHHSPLHWFVFAPFSGLSASPGLDTIIFMRWIQLPLWLLGFGCLLAWMRGAAVDRWSRWAAIVIALCSSLFMLPAVEYRVDVLGCVLYVIALLLIQRMDRGPHIAFLAGSVLCFTAFANLRLCPMIALTALLARVIDFRGRRWAGNPRANWIFVGGIATFGLCACYFLATGSAATAYQLLIRDNYLGDHFANPEHRLFLFRLGMQFGLRRNLASEIYFDPSGIDLAGIAVLLVGLTAIGRALLQGRKNPDHLFFLASLQVFNLLFIAKMKYIFNYHFEIVVMMMIPLIAMELGRLDRKRIVMAALILFLIANAATGLFRGKEADSAYQDLIMREVDRATPPGSRVFDSVGWALHRDPAYHYWFLRMIVTLLEERGYFATYDYKQAVSEPPAAVIADHDTLIWMATHRQLAQFVVSHYLPSWRDLWLPGMSARMGPQTPTAGWLVPADGDYQVFASTRLAGHPWFAVPLSLNRPVYRNPAVRPSESDRRALEAPLRWTLDGRESEPTQGRLQLRRGQHLAVTYEGVNPIGVMLVRGDPSLLFRFPPRGVSLEAASYPEWHIPTASAVFRGTSSLEYGGTSGSPTLPH